MPGVRLLAILATSIWALMGAAATIAGQSLGAGRPDRVTQGTWVAARIGLMVAAGIGLLFVSIPGYLLAFFGGERPSLHNAFAHRVLAFWRDAAQPEILQSSN